MTRRTLPRWRWIAALLLGLIAAVPAAGERPVVILSTTTSTQDSGLLDVLVPRFEKKTGYTVKPISVGTGQALALAARGEADVTLAHAPDLEKKYLAEGAFLNRRLVMYNDFVLVGPPDDPANVKPTGTAAHALKLIARHEAPFLSRGDNSGTHRLEQSLWTRAGIEPRGAWYIESGRGMGAALVIADDKRAYALTDRATYLAFRKRLELVVVLEGDKSLLNIYSVMEVNPANGPRVNASGGKAFADFLVSPEAQAVIRTFGVDTYGRPLFIPVAGMKEDDVGG